MEDERRILPEAPFHRILKKAGAPRVAQWAVEDFRDLVEEYANETAVKIVELQKHTQRNTVKREDIKAVKKFL